MFEVGLRPTNSATQPVYNDRVHETLEEALDDVRTLIEDTGGGTTPREIDKLIQTCAVKVRMYMSHCRNASVAPTTNEFVITCGDGNDAVLTVRCTW